METLRHFNKPFGFCKKPFFLISVSILLLMAVYPQVVCGQTHGTDKNKMTRQVALNWIDVGERNFSAGYYMVAERALLRAQDYQKFLKSDERKHLGELLEKAHLAAIERKRILKHIQTADELVEQNQLVKAQSHLETVRDSEFLTREERQLISDGLRKISGQLEQRRREIAELYNRSVEYYKSGQYEKAREGFVKIAGNGLLVAPNGKTSEDYLKKIDDAISRRIRQPAVYSPKVVRRVPKAKRRQPAARVSKSLRTEVVERPAEKLSYIEIVNRKRNILRGHTKAVVRDAIATAHSYISQGEFDKAKEALANAEQVVNENYLQLGDYLFKEYSSQLKQLTERIERYEKEQFQQVREQKQLEAIEAHSELRKQSAADRKKTIDNLMAGAMAYQKQQRYEEALGQLESLLALDPLNDNALVLKQTLEDMISFRKQLEVQKEMDKERVGIFLKTDEAGIPYAEEMTHPKNWREIVSSPYRQAEGPIGEDPANIAVYKQLDEIVDLSELRPTMPFSEAIDEIRNSVEPPLRIVVLWRDLIENADIDQTTEINMDAISAVPLGTALNLLLKSVSGGFAELGYVIENGVITIATVESLPSEMETLVYDVTDLIGRPADYYVTSGGGTGGGRGGGGGGRGGGGSRGGGAGGGGMGGGYFEEYFEEEAEEIDRDQLLEELEERKDNLILLIQDTIEPDSWYEAGGEGTITFYENKKLIVRQTREIHNKIEQLLGEMRKALGHQVSIEARFLVVGENFLEDIGLDVDFTMNIDHLEEATEGFSGPYYFQQRSSNAVIPEHTGLPGSWGGLFPDVEYPPDSGLTVPGGAMVVGFAGSILDDLQAQFLIRATQAHRDARSLIAPKVTVLTGEQATMQVQRTIRFPLLPTQFQGGYGGIDTGAGGGGYGGGAGGMEQNYGEIPVGPTLNITPTITPDKKHVLLNIVTEIRDFLGFETTTIETPILGAAGVEPQLFEYSVTLPQTERSRVQTRVSVPDGGTLLLGGLKKTEEVEVEAGVPILSKIPLLGRAFDNRSKIKDQKILLILVKPTIILQEEADAGAIAAMEDEF